MTKIQLKLKMAELQSGATVKFKLVDVLDWPKFFAQHKNVTFDEILDKLDNSSLAQLYQHFYEMVNDNTLFNCLEIIETIAKQRKFNIYLPQPTVQSNPLTPLKK